MSDVLRNAAQAALDAMERYQVKRQDFDRFHDEVSVLRAALAEPQGWIPCSERMPEPWEEVLAWEVDCGALVAAKAISPKSPWYVWNWEGQELPEITHWMPLPDAPSAEGSNVIFTCAEVNDA
jgi:hypothetical protein